MAADVNDLIKAITADVKTIVRDEISLAKSELIPAGKNAGLGAGMFGGAGYFGINAISLLFMAGGFGIGALFEHFLHWPVTGATAIGFVIMAVLLLILAGILALIGKNRISKVKGPERTQREAVKTVDESKAAIARGMEDVNSGRSLEEYIVEKDELRHDAVARRAAHAGPSFVNEPAVAEGDVVVPSGATSAGAQTSPVTGATPAQADGATRAQAN